MWGADPTRGVNREKASKPRAWEGFPRLAAAQLCFSSLKEPRASRTPTGKLGLAPRSLLSALGLLLRARLAADVGCGIYSRSAPHKRR